MSELKAVHAFDVYEAYTKTGDDDAAQVYPKGEVDAAIEELKAENRKLKRSLWLARAYFCARSCEFFSGIMNHCLIGQEDLYNRCEKKKNKYLNATNKCRAKVKEYK